MNTAPLVSVWMVTYNHRDYITQAVESVMMQKTRFDFHLYIGEDCSTDSTRDICKELYHKYPDKITLILNEKNLGAIQNARNIYTACFQSGSKYIAMLEGDDYWTDPLKLQKQVDFLEANFDYSICFHNVKIFNQEKNALQKDTITREVNETTGEEDLAMGNYIHTPSVVLRNDFKIPSWFDKVQLGDWSLYMLSIKGRKIFKFEEEMAAYRLHSQSIWSKLNQEKRNILTIANVEIILKNLKLRNNIKNILRNRLGLKVKKSLLKRILNKLKQKFTRFA